MQLPTLYQEAQTGKIKFWAVEAIPSEVGGPAILRKTHGFVDGKKQHKDREIIGKNAGRANATTPYEQACKMARSDYRKKLDKGYVQSTDGKSKIILPMLAQNFRKSGHRIDYPAYVQPKLNGVRCLAICTGQDETVEVNFISRKGKSYDAVCNHLRPHLVKLMKPGEIYDGELYIHGMSLQKIVRLTKKYRPGETEQLQFWIYDTVSNESFEDRWINVIMAINRLPTALFPHFVSGEVNSADEVKWAHDMCVTNGFEGLIIRNANAPYAINKRSKDLQKYKEFMEDEFEIIDVLEGSGTEAGCAVFEVKNKHGQKFKSRPAGSFKTRQRWFRDRGNLVGKMLTVRYFELSDDNIPTGNNVGIVIRDYE